MPDPIPQGNGQQPQQAPPPSAAPEAPPSPPSDQSTFEPQFAPDIFDDSGDFGGDDLGGGDTSATSLREHLTQQGINVGEYSDADLLNVFSHTLTQVQQIPQLQQMAAYGQEYLKYADKIAELQKAEQAPPQPEQQKKPAWQAPEVNPRALEFAERDARTGRFKAKDGYESLISPIELNKLNEYDDFIRSKSQEMWKDPYGFMWQGLEDRVAEKVNEIVQGQLTVAQQQQQANDFVTRNMQHFFQMDHNGQLIYDATGQPALTERGRVFSHFASEAEQRYGIQDPIAKQHYAAERLQAFEAQQALQQYLQQQAGQQAEQPDDGTGEPPQQQAPPPAQTPEQANQQRRKAFSRARSASRGNRSSSSGADNTPPENGHLSFKQMARRTAIDQGLLPQTG